MAVDFGKVVSRYKDGRSPSLTGTETETVYIYGELIMAHDSKYENAPRKKSSANTRASSTASTGWKGWVNVSLPDGAKKQWMDWSADPTHFYDALYSMCADGYKITIKYEEKSSAFSAFATPVDSGHSNAGWGISERAGDPFTAVHRLVYIHSVVLGGDWEPYKQPTGYRDRWES